MKILKKIIYFFAAILIILLLYLGYVQYWFWHRTLTHEDKITIECVPYDPGCPNESRFNTIQKVYEKDYEYITDKKVELVCFDQKICTIISKSYNNSQSIIVTGYVYKDGNHTSFYDKNCEVDAIRFKVVEIELK